jgi:hypothetical protein
LTKSHRPAEALVLDPHLSAAQPLTVSHR